VSAIVVARLVLAAFTAIVLFAAVDTRDWKGTVYTALLLTFIAVMVLA
jgi:hypothetical protein